MKKFFLFCFVFLSIGSFGQILDTETFANESERQRAVSLAKSLRCPQCQNQNLVESTSPVAYDLRLEVYALVKKGKSDDAIIQHMTERFGDFVRYDPPKNLKTAFLWLLPLAILCFLLFFLRQNHQSTPNIHLKKEKIFPILGAENFSTQNTFIAFLTLGLLSTMLYALTPRWQNLQQAEQEKIARTLKPQQETYLELLQNDLRQSPKNTELWLKLAEFYLDNKEMDLALAVYQHLEDLQGKEAYLFGLQAHALYQQQGFTPEVKTLIQNALEKNPQERYSLMLLANHAFQQKNFQKAQALYQQLLASADPKLNRRAIIHALNTAKFLDKSPKL